MPRRGSVAFILVVLLLDTLGFGLVLPVLPRLVAGFFGGDAVLASRFYGVFVASYAGMQLICAPLLGALSDRFGRRPVILLSLLGAALNYVLCAVAPGLGWLLVGRLVAGATGARLSTATAYIADVTPPEHRARSFGLVGAALGLGFIVGPVVGGLAGDIDVRAPFVVAAALNLVNMLYGLVILPESLAVEHRRPVDLSRATPLGSMRSFARSPLALGLSGTIACGYLAQWVLQSIWALSLQARFGWSSADVGASLAALGLSGAVAQAGLVRAAVARFGERRSLLVGLAFGVAGQVALGSATEGWMIYAAAVLCAPAGIAGPVAQALLSRDTSASEQGELQGSLGILQSLCAITGPLLGTTLLGHFSSPQASLRVPGAPFFAAAALNATGLLLAVRLFGKRPGELR